jgi:hypothetical protein
MNACDELAFCFPEMLAELQRASEGFQSISTQGVIRGCVGAIDGWLCPIIVPPRAVVGNVRSYFSGHYQRYGINVQAVIDHLCRFSIYIAVAAPGSQPDINVIARTNLPNVLAALPLGFFILETTPTPHPNVLGGANHLNPDNDNFNYVLSQCRIRVEMAFGMMTQRFGVLARPLRIHPRRIGTLMETIARLHNYTINHNHGLVNEDAARNPVISANAGPGMVQSAEQPATPIQGESVIPNSCNYVQNLLK